MSNQKNRSNQQFPYQNRELSWIDFNNRVLEEAQRKDNPIFERLKFLAITSSNLDEFFMVRVAGLYESIQSGYSKKDCSGLTASEQMKLLSEKIHIFSDKQYNCYNRSIIPVLKNNNIHFLKLNNLDNEQNKFIKDYFEKMVFPVLTPMAVDRSRPFPLLGNKTVNIAVMLSNEKKELIYAVIQVPSILPRFIELPSKEGKQFILLENIIIKYLDDLFELYKIKAYCPFRITRDSDLEIDEEADNLMQEIEKSIKKRKRGKPVRLELQGKCNLELKSFLTEMLDIDDEYIYKQNGPLDLTFLMKFSSLKGYNDLKFDPIIPVSPAPDFYGYDNMFTAIREGDRLVHHPYDSFDEVIKFVSQAASDKNVLAIKQTLYRVSGNSPIIAALIKAAENGKQVTVLVELKARFDEENNINWAKKLEKAGCHVIYGLQGLKTHCKICLVVRKENNEIRRYLHLGTGNYNDSTAKIYTDIGLFTCREDYGEDASSLFNVLTGYSRPPEYNKFIVAPLGMRIFFEDKINNEIENAKKGIPAAITAKINSLVDPEIIKLLYKASNAGVKVILIVRGICCLIPNLEDYSKNIKVYSIVGQLLEHSRIFIFENAGNKEYYLGSADWMQRNLNRRVELVFPVEDDSLKVRVQEIIDISLKDNTNKRVMSSDTKYSLVKNKGKKFTSQKEFSQLSKLRLKDKKLYFQNFENENNNFNTNDIK